MVNHMESFREDTYMSPMPSLQEIFPYNSNGQQISERRGNEEIALITDYHVEDRRKSEVQFDFAIIRGENGYGILTVFDNASSTTLRLRELIENGTVRAKYTKDVQLVKGIGRGATNADVAEVVLNKTDGKTVKIHALVVENIMTTEIKSEDSMEQVTQQSVDKTKEDFRL